MVDDDFRDPVNVYVYIYLTNADNRQGWGSPIATRQALGVTSSTVQISWDGRIGNTHGEGEYAEPWTYTYDVEVYQEDINEEDFGSEDPNRACGVGDRYQSEYLTIYRDVDEQGQPIYDAEYYGYDEGDPEDPNDDNYIYLIRRYRLEDFVFMGELKDASEGEVWLYNPDLEKVGTWEISSLQCLNHDNECDGLHAVYEEGHDTRHALLVPVPVSMMDEGGTYIFVLRIKDDHPELYRDHQHRWTLELNATSRPAGVCVYKGSRLDLYKDITETWNALKDRWLAVFNPFINRWEYQRITDGMTRELDGRFHVAKNVNCEKPKECVLSSLQYGSYTRVGGQVNRHSPPIWILFAHGFGGYAMECKKKQALVSTHAKGLEMEEDGWQYCAVSSLPAGSLTSLQLAVLLGVRRLGVASTLCHISCALKE